LPIFFRHKSISCALASYVSDPASSITNLDPAASPTFFADSGVPYGLFFAESGGSFFIIASYNARFLSEAGDGGSFFIFMSFFDALSVAPLFFGFTSGFFFEVAPLSSSSSSSSSDPDPDPDPDPDQDQDPDQDLDPDLDPDQIKQRVILIVTSCG
jgi:hypothetical protein